MTKNLLSTANKKVLVFLGLFFFSAGAFAQVTYTDTVCAGSTDVVYGIAGADTASVFTWWIDTASAGVIDNSLATNDSVIQVDWGTSPGTYTLYAMETTIDGCSSDTVELNIVISPLPTVALTGDSICSGANPNVTFAFTGSAPWIVEYTDGSTNFTDTANTATYTASLPPYSSNQTISVTGLSDANGCAADTTGLPTAPVVIITQPSTGPIYHY